MAINFESYVRNYANTGSNESAENVGKAIARGVSAIPTAQDRIQTKANDVISEVWAPSLNLLQTDPSTWDVNFMDAGSAYSEFSASLSPRETRIGKRKGLLNPTSFINAYDSYRNLYLPSIEEKLLEFKMANNMSTTDMQRFVTSKPGLAKLLIKSEKPEIKNWTNKVTTMADVGENVLNFARDIFVNPTETIPDMTPGEFTKKLAGPAALAGYGGYKLKKGGVFDKEQWKMPGMGRPGKILGSEKYVQRAAKELLPKPGTSSQELLDQARSKYTSMSKKHGGPGQTSKVAKDLRNTIKKLETRTAREIKRPQNLDDVKELWNKLSKKFGGRAGVRKALFKAVGPVRGAWLMARLGLGAAGTFVPEALSTIAGVALTGYSLYQVANILFSMAEE